MVLAKWTSKKGAGSAAAPFTLPLELEDGKATKAHRALVGATILLLTGATLWAAYTPIREVAIASGTIVPRSDVRTVQHLEGGIVAEILQQAGGRVREGDPLIRLDDSQAGRDLAQLKIRLSGLEQQKAQLSMLLEAARNGYKEALLTTGSLQPVYQSVLENRISEKRDERKTLESRIAQKASEVEIAQREVSMLEELVAMRSQMLREGEALLKEGLSTKRVTYDDKAALDQSAIQLLSANGRLKRAAEELSEAQSLLGSAESSALRSWSEELSKVTAEALELREAIAKQEDRFARLLVRAPVDGVVQVVTLKSKGDVVKPGDAFMKIVPVGVPLQAEVQIRPEDIGSVKVGDVTELKVTAFDAALFGKISGTIESISPSSFQKENGEYFYRAVVAISDNGPGGKVDISPGMTVTAEIVTGAKSFLRYLLKPVFKVLDPAFSER